MYEQNSGRISDLMGGLKSGARGAHVRGSVYLSNVTELRLMT